MRYLRWKIALTLLKCASNELEKAFKHEGDFKRHLKWNGRLMKLSFKFVPSDQRLDVMSKYDSDLRTVLKECKNMEPE